MTATRYNYRYQLLNKNMEKLDISSLIFLDQQTRNCFTYTAREVIGNNEFLLELHPYDIRLVCILAMQEYYEF